MRSAKITNIDEYLNIILGLSNPDWIINNAKIIDINTSMTSLFEVYHQTRIHHVKNKSLRFIIHLNSSNHAWEIPSNHNGTFNMTTLMTTLEFGPYNLLKGVHRENRIEDIKLMKSLVLIDYKDYVLK